ncbi:GNAT family N-acetyltransferase [Exiguobacterium sp. s193]|uniref:GNAT family N-acetyltransferase n=1 Tax=Exiguobacterium sp. s193 TaxID=2751207 RepID=UPI001BE59F58|nr:GNAT family N-acetyltransferase [Exiguobacterium sp. s193]
MNPIDTNERPLTYTIRPAERTDARQLALLRARLDAETDHFDRFPGEDVLDEEGFLQLIQHETGVPHFLLVAEVDRQLVGYARCVGFPLRRFAHKADFGVGVVRDFWGQGIGRALLQTTLDWARTVELQKIQLAVVETNQGAVRLYQTAGFQIEGRLKHDRLLADGLYYDTILMGILLD